MGFRFRKSIKLGKGFRINLSKSGVGWSMGTKAFRYTKKAGGGSRTTSTIPGTGISYSKDYPSSKNKRPSQSPNNIPDAHNGNILEQTYTKSHGILWWLFLGWWLWAVLLIVTLIIPQSTVSSSSDISSQDLLSLQKILVANSPDHLVMSKKQLIEAAQIRITNNMRIIEESNKIVESTRDIDTFFSRYDLIVEKYKECVAFEPYISFGGHTPSEAYNQAISELNNAFERFIYRHIDNLTLESLKLKTEKGRQNRYSKSHADFQRYFDRISSSNWSLIESEFKRIIL